MFYLCFPGKRGRPQLDIPDDDLIRLYELNYTACDIAKALNCSTQYVYKRLYALGKSMRQRYTNVSNTELTERVQALHERHPNAGSVVSKVLL